MRSDHPSTLATLRRWWTISGVTNFGQAFAKASIVGSGSRVSAAIAGDTVPDASGEDPGSVTLELAAVGLRLMLGSVALKPSAFSEFISSMVGDMVLGSDAVGLTTLELDVVGLTTLGLNVVGLIVLVGVTGPGSVKVGLVVMESVSKVMRLVMLRSSAAAAGLSAPDGVRIDEGVAGLGEGWMVGIGAASINGVGGDSAGAGVGGGVTDIDRVVSNS